MHGRHGWRIGKERTDLSNPRNSCSHWPASHLLFDMQISCFFREGLGFVPWMPCASLPVNKGPHQPVINSQSIERLSCQGEGEDLSFSLPAPLKSQEKGKLYFNMNEGLIFVILSWFSSFYSLSSWVQIAGYDHATGDRLSRADKYWHLQGSSVFIRLTRGVFTYNKNKITKLKVPALDESWDKLKRKQGKDF